MERRHFLASLVAGCALGLTLGLATAYLFWPVDFTNADPAQLRTAHQDDYIRMISAEYYLDGDLLRAKQRLGALGLDNPVTRLRALELTETHPLMQRALLRLDLDLQNPPAAALQAAASPSPSPSRRAVAPLGTVPPTLTSFRVTPTNDPITPSPLAVQTDIPNPDVPSFRRAEKRAAGCDENQEGLIVVLVQDSQGQAIPGIAAQVSWQDGRETIFTGLKPEHGLGYADFIARPGTYSIRLTENAASPEISGLRIDPRPPVCRASGVTRGWQIVFSQ